MVASFFTRVSITLCLFLVTAVLFTGCSKEDDELSERQDNFYKGALSSANAERLAGVWSIYEVAFEGKSAEVPVNFQDCGRDFFQFTANGIYKEYIYTSTYECEKEVLDLNWELEKGVIALWNDWGQSDEMVILELGAEKLVFKMKFDIDEDPGLEVLSFVARRYAPPNDPDLYSYTFGVAQTNRSEDEIKLSWQAFEGFYQFDRYEIYRSSAGCNKANAELIATIKDRSQNFFLDEDPPVAEELCYYIKIYNEKGLLGESELTEFFTADLKPAKVEFTNVEVLNNEVKLEWQPYQGNYFSHYEIKVRNYKDQTGYGFQEYPVKVIEDKENSTFLDENPPRLKNPVYTIYAYDIFGNVSSNPYSADAVELDWTHPEVLDFQSIQFVAVAPDASEIFLYGRYPGGAYNLIKYNYRDHEVSATANKLSAISTSVAMQVYKGPNGQELFFAQGNELAVYDAADLTYKYRLVVENVPWFGDFAYLGNNIFAFTDSKNIYTFRRDNSNFEFIAKRSHFSAHQGNGDYDLIPLKNNDILVGHAEEPANYKFSISTSGDISTGELVNIPIKSRWDRKTLYSSEKNYILNLPQNKLYSTLSFSLQHSFESPYYPSGISKDGNLIFGTNNDPQEDITTESLHEKKVRIYNLTTGKLTTIETKGYPHLIFENHLGEIISISSGFKRASLQNYAPKPDIFVEVIN